MKFTLKELEELDDPIVLAQYLPSIVETLKAYEEVMSEFRSWGCGNADCCCKRLINYVDDLDNKLDGI